MKSGVCAYCGKEFKLTGMAMHQKSCRNKKRGGKREGAGRPKLKDSEKKEPTKVMRIPDSKVNEVKKIIEK